MPKWSWKNKQQRFAEQNPGAEGVKPIHIDCEENRASLFSRLLFSWATPVIIRGWKTPIQLGELPDIGLGSELVPSAISERFQAEWAKERRRANGASSRKRSKFGGVLNIGDSAKRAFKRQVARITGNSMLYSENMHRKPPMPRLANALYPLVSGYLIRALLARLITELVPVFLPILVKIATVYAQHKRSESRRSNHSQHAPKPGLPDWQGYVLASGIFGMLIVYSWSFQWFFFEVGKATIVVRTALASAIYRKSLVLSAQARSRQTLGRLTNLISSDLGQIERGVANMLVCITIPVQVVASVVVLIYMIGPSSICGWALVVAFVPIQMWCSRYLVRLRKSAVQYTDKRIKATREALQGIKVVKFFVWENSIWENIERIRKQETKCIAWINLVRYGLISLALHSPVAASVLTFVIFTLAGGRLRTGPVFAVIGIFNAMSVPLSWLPGALTETRNSLVPLQRITEALLEEEIDPPMPPQPMLDVAVRVSHGRFAWRYHHSAPSVDLDSRAQLRESRNHHHHHPAGNRNPNNIRHSSGISFYYYRFPPGIRAGEVSCDLQSFHLDGINLAIAHGSLVAVIGSVGSGKTSLMNALVGEMKCISGTMAFGGTISYASQIPWAINATIRENITFGLPFDEEKYADVIEACALDVDFTSIPGGDMAEIGERGVTLSGGQKQRIGIARAAYAESDITLLDDCLSAVDVRVSHSIFRHCIRGFLSGKTRVLVTNCLDYLAAVDYIVTMDSGRIVEQGSFHDLMALGGMTASMFKSYTSKTTDDSAYATDRGYCFTTGSSLRTASPIRATANYQEQPATSTSPTERDGESTSGCHATDVDTSIFDIISSDGSQRQSEFTGNIGSPSGEKIAVSERPKHQPDNRRKLKLMSDEDRETGLVSMSTYMAYIRAGGGWWLLFALIACLGISQACRVGSDFWMRLWIRHRKQKSTANLYILVYALLGAMQFLWFGLFAAFLVLSVYKSSRKLHSRALRRLLKAPMALFDTTPLGRILNRFTRDIDSLDLALCDFLRQFYQNTARSLGSFVSIAILVPVFLVPLVPLFVVSWVLIYVYLRTSVELQRVAAISRSPLYAHYAETLQGLPTIRAYNAQARYILKNDQAIDTANRPQWYSLVAQNWVWLRVDCLSHILSLAVCIIVVVQPAKWDAAAVGLMLVQATQMGAYVSYAGRGWTELQNNMNSAERINHYATALEQEEGNDAMGGRAADSVLAHQPPMRAPPDSWPERGAVIIHNLSMRYRPELPLALRGINLEVGQGERVGIVGRSGAGKSSIISALFRLVEPADGKVYIDGVDIQAVSLDRLRRSICILPQDPVLFDGTLRTNLDPFHELGDADIWSVLDQVCLRDAVALQPARLEMPVGEGGENLSTGQRQLVCLARALLRKPKLLILDEATANVDHETDAAIQRIILSDIQGTTVISIAHRLQTLIRYDKIAVVDDGKVVEMGSPLSLLKQHVEARQREGEQEQHHSIFYSMVKEMGEDALQQLTALAQAAQDSKRYTSHSV